MAHKKAGGSSRNGRDSHSKRLGVKAYGGEPVTAGASVQATVVSHGRGPKVEIFKMRRRKNYRRHQGHRQGFTELQIDGITG